MAFFWHNAAEAEHLDISDLVLDAHFSDLTSF